MVIDPRRKTIVGVIDVFKDCARRNAAAWSELFARRPDLHEDWAAAGAIADQKNAAARQEIIDAAKGDLMGAYDTITRGLFKYPKTGETEVYGMCINPLSLLTACGNNRGCGDYHAGFPDYNKVGLWAFDKIELTRKKLVQYQEVMFSFTEQHREESAA